MSLFMSKQSFSHKFYASGPQLFSLLMNPTHYQPVSRTFSHGISKLLSGSHFTENSSSTKCNFKETIFTTLLPCHLVPLYVYVSVLLWPFSFGVCRLVWAFQH